jgi:hypothetical protein
MNCCWPRCVRSAPETPPRAACEFWRGTGSTDTARMEPLRRRRTAAEDLPWNNPDTSGHHRSGRKVQPIAGPLTAVNSVLIGGTPGQARRTLRGRPQRRRSGDDHRVGALAEYLARQRATGQAARQSASAPPPANSNSPAGGCRLPYCPPGTWWPNGALGL